MNLGDLSLTRLGSTAQVWQQPLPFLSQALIFLREIPDVLRLLERSAGPAIGFDHVNLIVPDPHSQQLRLHYLTRTDNTAATLEAHQISEMPAAQVFLSHSMLQCDGPGFRREYPQGAELPPYSGLEAYCLIPLNVGSQRIGGIEFIRLQKNRLDGKSLLHLRQLADVVGAAVGRILERAQLQFKQDQARKEREHYRLLVEVTNAALSKLDMNALVDEVAAVIHNYFGFDYITLDTCDLATHSLHTHSVHFQENGSRIRNSVRMSMYTSLSGQVMLSKEKALLDRRQIEELSSKYSQVAAMANQGFQMILALPLISGGKARGALKLGHHRPYIFSQRKFDLLEQIAARLAIVLDNALAYEELSTLKDKLASENQYLTEEIRNYAGFDEIIGSSMAMQEVLRQVEMVAASDATVLILGETGTGKELIARAIHRLSNRNTKTMVKMNCAAVPAGLLESDLFGHERGAFTGAQTQRLGRFELAHKSTLFLDEVGDLPLELQPKLLRVLQECEIQRLGGTKVIPVDVRVVAATNCDLRQKVMNHQYRSDLFYRLNVFPIVLPALRERAEDIPLLARFFMQKYAQRMGRRIESIPPESMARLVQMPWPGNVRELENFIERAVILTRGSVLELPLDEIPYQPASPVVQDQPSFISMPGRLMPPRYVEPPAPVGHDTPVFSRESIIRVLRETHGILYGPNGAAARLGLKRTTLIYRLRRLGISAKDYRDEAWKAA